MHAFYADPHVLPLPQGHRFPISKFALLRERVEVETELTLHPALPASEVELALAHVPAYIAAVLDGSLSAAQQRESGFPWSEALVARSRRSVGATINAARAALAGGVGANLAGGSHHASADRGSGYCVFNDVAVAARLMQAEWLVRARLSAQLPAQLTGKETGQGSRHAPLRVAVIDLDVHQGNGTAAIFADDPSVYTLSLHGAKNFPFRKEHSDLDVALPDGCTDDAYLGALDAALFELWRCHADAPPGLVFYVAGADAHEGDRLGRLKLTTAGLAERDRRVFTATRARCIPTAVVMAGGYGRVIEDTVEVHLNTLRAAQNSWQGWNNADS